MIQSTLYSDQGLAARQHWRGLQLSTRLDGGAVMGRVIPARRRDPVETDSRGDGMLISPLQMLMPELANDSMSELA